MVILKILFKWLLVVCNVDDGNVVCSWFNVIWNKLFVGGLIILLVRFILVMWCDEVFKGVCILDVFVMKGKVVVIVVYIRVFFFII